VDDHPGPIEELARLLDLHRFYLERPDESELIAADADLEAEIDQLLRRLRRRSAAADLWDALFDWVGWENLEERWAGPGRIDPRVLEHLRRQAADR
jgi:uncharacterized Ntn-hydrolase superfamily protein